MRTVPDGYMTLLEAASALHCDPVDVMNLIADGELQAYNFDALRCVRTEEVLRLLVSFVERLLQAGRVGE
jgi:hypothetical protein